MLIATGQERSSAFNEAALKPDHEFHSRAERIGAVVDNFSVRLRLTPA